MLGIIPRLIRNLLSKPMTVDFPDESIPIPDDYRGAHEYDIDECISCGLCANVCPNMAIEMIEAPDEYKEEYPKTYPKVDLGKCCFCGLCEDVCPTDALSLSKNFFLSTMDSSTTFVEPFPEVEEIDE
ncbi:MAG: 4Fe-4S binding protein [Thermoplasmata archaeon]